MRISLLLILSALLIFGRPALSCFLPSMLPGTLILVGDSVGTIMDTAAAYAASAISAASLGASAVDSTSDSGVSSAAAFASLCLAGVDSAVQAEYVGTWSKF